MKTHTTCIRIFADAEQINSCRNILNENEQHLLRFSTLLTLAGNDVRLKILFLLDIENELCPCDLSDILGMSVPAVSQHLRKLKDGGLIESKREGQTIFYSLNKNNADFLNPFFSVINQHSKLEAL